MERQSLLTKRVASWRDTSTHVLFHGPITPLLLRLAHQLSQRLAELDGVSNQPPQLPMDVLEELPDAHFHRSALSKQQAATSGVLQRPRGNGAASSTEEHSSALPVVQRWNREAVTVNIHSTFVSLGFFKSFFQWLEQQIPSPGAKITVLVLGVQRVSLDGQGVFLNSMEKLTERVRFLFVCGGGIHQLLDPLVSRCAVLGVSSLSLEEGEVEAASSAGTTLQQTLKRLVLLPLDHCKRPAQQKTLEACLLQLAGTRPLWNQLCRRQLLAPLMVEAHMMEEKRRLTLLRPKFTLVSGQAWTQAFVAFCDKHCLPHEEVLLFFLQEYYAHIRWDARTAVIALSDHADVFALLQRQPASARWALSSFCMTEIAHHQ